MRCTWSLARSLAAIACGVVAVIVVAPSALGTQASSPKTSTTPKLLGSPSAGKSIFETNCAACHTLAAAGAEGTIGPNLNHIKLSEALIIEQVENGGSGVIGAAAASKYTTSMVGYKNVLSKTQIENVAAFVYTAAEG